MVHPLGRCEHQAEHRREDHAHQPPGRPPRHPGNPLAPQHDEHGDEQRQRSDEEAEPSRQRAVHGRQDQIVVPQVLGVPLLAGADVGADAGSLEHRCQGLVSEDHRKDHRARREQRRHQWPGAQHRPAPHQDSQDGTSAGEQGGDRDKAGRLDAQGERRRKDRQRGRGQPPRCDGPFDEYIGDQRPGGDLPLGTQAVIERHPRRQQDQARGPQCGATARHRRPQSRQHLAGEQQPAEECADEVRQPDPEAGRADVSHQCQNVVVPAEGILRHSEPAEVVRHVTRAVGDPGHAQDVAVIGGVGAHHVPDQEGAHHRHIDGGEGLPARGYQPVHAATVEPVQAPQARHRDDGGGDRQQHRGQFQRRRPRGEPGVDGRRNTEAGRGGAGQIGENPDDRRPEIGVGETAAAVVVTLLRRVLAGIIDGRLGRNADESCERSRFR